MPIFKRLLGNFLIFTTFPPEDSLGLFVCYEGHIQDVKTAEIVFVAICSRSYHKMPVLLWHIKPIPLYYMAMTLEYIHVDNSRYKHNGYNDVVVRNPVVRNLNAF